MGSRDTNPSKIGLDCREESCRSRTFGWCNHYVRFHTIPVKNANRYYFRALSTDGYPLHKLPFSSMILVEPGMMTREIYAVAFKEPTLFKQVIERTRKGKDIWPSRDAALKWLSERSPWKRWDPRVLRLFIVSLPFID